MAIKILVAEDSAVYRRMVTSNLQDWGLDFVVAEDGSRALELLQERPSVQMALLDWVLPGVDGIDLCRKIRQRSADDYIYTILLTGKNDRQDFLTAMAAGADDFLTKPFDPAELKVRLQAGKRIIELQQELLAAKESLRFAATHDGLTTIWNRSEVFAFLERELARSKRQQTPVSALLVDLDHFKRVNDLLGHLAGDCVLKEVARRIRAELRAYDAVGRYGGEEFLLVLPGCELAPAIERADEVRKTIAAETVLTPQGKASVTISVGVATRVGSGPETLGELLQEADLALYQAKGKGRNRVDWSAGIASGPLAPTLHSR